MAFLQRRFFSASSYRQVNRAHYESARPSLAIPSPTSGGAVLNSPELQQLATKAKGQWGQLTNEEAVKLYRATFPKTFKEIAAGSGHYRIVVPLVAANLVIGYFLASFLRKTVGPTLPHTFENEEWEDAMVERHLKNKANPITGISSKYSKHAQKVAAEAKAA